MGGLQRNALGVTGAAAALLLTAALLFSTNGNTADFFQSPTIATHVPPALSTSGTSAKLRTLQHDREYSGLRLPVSVPRVTIDPARQPCAVPLIAVVTTIFAPSRAILELAASHRDVPVIVIGDVSGPPDWATSFSNVEYVSPAAQERVSATAAGADLSRVMPWRHFGRKNVGFLLAVERRACAIWDFDDDNVLRTSAGFNLSDAMRTALAPALTVAGVSSVMMGVRPRGGATSPRFPFNVTNPYFALAPTRFMWPRGYPVQLVEGGRTGASYDTPELVRLSASAADDVVVLQAAANGNPDVDALFRLTEPPGDIRFEGALPLVVLAPGTFCPYNAQATAHRPRGYWALYLPVTVHGRVSDIWRSYIAQAVFGVLGLHVGFTQPWVVHERTEHSIVGDHKAEADLYELAVPLLSLLTQWQAQAAATYCASSSRSGGPTALTLLEDLYITLYEHKVISETDIIGVQAWLSALQSAGYAFPSFNFAVCNGSHNGIVLSPQRAPVIDAHVAVHMNNGFSSSIPIWHILHAAQYRSVTYHIESRDPAKSLAPVSPSIFPHLVRGLDFYDRGPGYLAYRSVVHAWNERMYTRVTPTPRIAPLPTLVDDPLPAALIWQHDDAVLNPAMVAEWVARGGKSGPSNCLAMTEPCGDPMPAVANWSRHEWWFARLPHVQASSKVFIDDRGVQSTCTLRNTPDVPLRYGQSDVVAMRGGPGCDGPVGTFLSLLKSAATRYVFLEVAVPTSMCCAANPVTEWPLLTTWDYGYRESARGGEWFVRQPSPSVAHPIKLGSFASAIAAAATIRDRVLEAAAAAASKGAA